MKNIRRSLGAVSPVVAVLMMIAIAVVGSLVLYGWFMGYISFETGKAREAIMISSIGNDGNNLVIYVTNRGGGLVELAEEGCLYIDGILASCTITGVTVVADTARVSEGETATLTFRGGSTLPGEKVEVKVTTLFGAYDTDAAYPAGSSFAPRALDHFAFDPIESPQTVDVPFEVTIKAVDQYGDRLTSYSGTNVLAFSGGGVSPLVTDSFVNGVWTGEATVTGAAMEATLTTAAQADPNQNGTSNIFDVEPQGIVYSDYPQYELLGGGTRWAARDGQTALYINWYDNWLNHHATDGTDWLWGNETVYEYLKTAITQTLEEWDFEVTCLGDLPTTLDELDGFDLILVEARYAAEPNLAPLIEDYISNGGGVVIVDAIPCYFSVYCKDGFPGALGGTDLTAIQHWLGCARFVNTGGTVSVVVDNPVGTSLHDGDTILDNDYGYNKAVTDLVSGTEVLATWSTGYIYAYTYEYGAGRVFYHGGTFLIITPP